MMAATYNAGVHLSFGDIAINNPHCPTFIKVFIKELKTDSIRKSVDHFIGHMSTDSCPVAVLLDL